MGKGAGATRSCRMTPECTTHEAGSATTAHPTAPAVTPRTPAVPYPAMLGSPSKVEMPRLKPNSVLPVATSVAVVNGAVGRVTA